MSNHFRSENFRQFFQCLQNIQFFSKNIHIFGKISTFWAKNPHFWQKTHFRFEPILADFRMRWFWKMKKFKHHKNVANHILFYVLIKSQHFTEATALSKSNMLRFRDLALLPNFNPIDQSESTAKILDLVPVNHWTDHKTNIVAASFSTP